MTGETHHDSPSPRWELRVGDCVELMKAMPENSVDAVVCDPPYGLEFMGKEWDRLWNGTRDPKPGGRVGSDGVYRTKTQPMSAAIPRGAPTYVGGTEAQEWHRHWAEEALRVLKPGGHLLAFGGTRTYHRLASAVEDSGFEIRDSIHWLYGSGFPKSHDVSKAVDSHLGAKRESTGMLSTNRETEGTISIKQSGDGIAYDKPATEEAATWDGWGTALKPSHEPIVVARKPLEVGLTVAENTLKWRTGGVNVDGCRVGFNGLADEGESKTKNRHADFGSGPRENRVYGADERERGANGNYDAPGRWPPNLLLVHSPGCRKIGTKTIKRHLVAHGENQFEGTIFTNGSVGLGDTMEEHDAFDCVPGCPVKELDQQSGHLNGRGNVSESFSVDDGMFGRGTMVRPNLGYMSDEGGASRFFPQFQWTEADFGFLYMAKANRGEREAGCQGLPRRKFSNQMRTANNESDTPSDGFERFESRNPVGNVHPTVKPIELCRWLVRLVTPTTGTVLDPFAGSGTTGCAALMEGFKFIGMEKEEEYAQIARARLTYWEKEGVKEQARVAREEKAAREQTTLEAFAE